MAKPTLKLLVGSWHLLKQVMAFGNPTAGGFTTMAEALWAVARLNKELMARFGIEFAVSAHWWHELLVPCNAPEIGYSAQWNNPRAINLKQWMDGVESKHLARIGRIIPPGFGLPGSDDGHFINPDPKRRELAHDMTVLSFRTSQLVRRKGVGEGHVIFWTGPDGIRWKRIVEGDDVLLGHDLNPQLEEWELVVNGVGGAVREAREAGFVDDDEEIEIETKVAGDPCYLDVFTDTELAIKGIRQINVVAGANVAKWQGELCHERGGGQRFSDALRQVINADSRIHLELVCPPSVIELTEQGITGEIFGGKIHMNAGGLGTTSFADLLSVRGGMPMSRFQQYVDPDYLPGEGPKEWLDDQRATIELGAKWSAVTGRPLEIEFDARFCRYIDTIGALRKSAEWTIAAFNEAVAHLDVPAAA
jgi:hypothetical protein